MQLDAAGLRRARVRSQLLSGPRRRGVEDVVRTVVGVQAQDRAAAARAIEVRGAPVRDLPAAWGEGGPLLVTWSLRGTRHLHHVDDVRWMLALTGPVFAAGTPARNRQLGIAGEAGDRAVRALRVALRRRGPLTRPQVRELLARRGLDPSGQAPIHVIRRAAMQGVLCVVPTPEGDETYAPLDDRAPPARGRPDLEAALAELARRYLHGYGPASPQDLVAWSGLPRRSADAAWASIAGELTEVAIPGGRTWILSADARSARATIARRTAVRLLLPAFDTLMLGYADRAAFVPAAHARKVNAGGGMIRPTVLTDEGIAGTWVLRRERDGTPRVEVHPFGRLRSAVRTDLEREVRAVERAARRPPPSLAG